MSTRTLGLFLLVMLLALAIGCSQQSSTARETREDGSELSSPLDNGAITMRIKTRLATNPDVSALRINVDTDNGVVTLTGTVDTQAEKDLAARIAREVEGVRDVRNNLQVSVESGGSGTTGNDNDNTGLTDAVITAAVKTSLAFKKDVKAHEIDVDTRDGVVTLSGTVSTQAEKDLAGEVTRDTAGVRRVINNLRVGS